MTTRRHITIILNSTSGRGQGARRRAELEALLAQAVANATRESALSPVEWRIVETTAPGSGTELAALAAAQGADIVAAAGGDGTLNEVVNGLVGTKAMLGLLPLGTGNDFARCIGLNTDLALAVQTLLHGVSRPIDLGRAQGRWFVNIAGCGFDAVVAARVNRGFRFLRGTSAYLAAIVHCLFSYRPAWMRLTLDGETREARAMLCSICNATSYGGGMRIAPNAQIDDGLFDICLISDAGKIEFLRAFPRVFQGTHLTHPKVTLLQARHVQIETEPPLPVLIDGDVVGTTPVEFRLTPRAIQMMAPTSAGNVFAAPLPKTAALPTGE